MWLYKSEINALVFEIRISKPDEFAVNFQILGPFLAAIIFRSQLTLITS